MKVIYERPKVFTDAITTYCGGCGHGIINKLIAELIDEMDLQKNGAIAWPIGCSCLADKFYNMDQIMCLHGRAPATATGMKRAEPNKFILVYQGDGDLASEGIAEIMHAAIRGEKFTVVFVNNAIYGMTGGQVAPTTLIGQKASTAPIGRDPINSGYPVNFAELLATFKGVAYSERVTVTNPANVAKCKKALRHAFELQLAGIGMTFVEVLSPCPTNWSMPPIKAMKWIDDVMVEQFPLGVFKDVEEEK